MTTINIDDVRVEDETSMGRSYSCPKQFIEGIGEERKKLTTKSHDPPASAEVTDSLTLADVHLNTASIDDLLKYFENTWDLTATLFKGLKNDSVFYSKPDRLRRPLIFYFAHPSSVYINKMSLAGLVDHVNPLYERMFETGVDEMSWDDMDDMQSEDYAWPTMDQTIDFREKVKTRMINYIKSMKAPSEVPITMSMPDWALVMGFDHERIHLETSSILIRQLPVSSVTKPDTWKYAPSHAPTPADAPKNALVSIPATTVKIGKPVDFPSFGWDNEYGERTVDVPSFQSTKFLVSNAGFLPFVMDNGYKTKKWWIAFDGDNEGWRWATYRNATHPSFWVAPEGLPEFCGGTPTYPLNQDEGKVPGKEFKLRALFSIIDMPWDWPVEVNYLEAKAFCRWKSAQDGVKYRLPTEAEHNAMRGDVPDGDDIMMHKDVTTRHNTNFAHGSVSPVDMYPPTSVGVHDVQGNVWDWVEDHFAPLPGGSIHYLYDDFSTPCYDGWHTMILGGAWCSTGDEASSYARFHFRRHFFQHSGFHMVCTSAKESWPGETSAVNLWEGQRVVSTAVSSTFPSSDPVEAPTVHLGDRYAPAVVSAIPKSALSGDALHVGCGIGSLSFELAGHLDSVFAVDADEEFIRRARVLKHHGEMAYGRIEEGVIKTETLGLVPGKPALRSKVRFKHAAEGLAEFLGDDAESKYDLVVVDNSLTRVANPALLLSTAAKCVKPGGMIVVACSNSWDKEFTSISNWLGGFVMNGEGIHTIDGVSRVLAKAGFSKAGSADVPRVTRKNNRKYEVDVMEM